MDETPGHLEGWTVQLLTGYQLEEREPGLLRVDHDRGEVHFNEMGADGNARWVDYWPDLILVVRDPKGRVVLTSNASVWHMEALGVTVPDWSAQ